MKNNFAFIKLFETSIGKYVYDVNRNSILKVPEEVYKFLNENNSSFENASPYIKNMLDYGFFKSDKVEMTKHPETDFLGYYMKNHLNTLLLQVTQNCNLRCDYCIYSGNYNTRTHNNLKMTSSIAKQGIDYLVKHSYDNDLLFLGFYGGEPLLEYPLIKECMDYTLKSVPTKKIHFSITTNGTLLTPKIVDQLINYNIFLLVSIDGPEHIHDESRRFASNNKGSFRKIYDNLKYIQDHYPEFYKNNINFNIVVHENGFNDVDEFVANDPLFSNSIFLANFISDNYTDKKYSISENSLIDYRYKRFLLYLQKTGYLKEYTPSKLLTQSFYKNIHIEDYLDNRVCLPKAFHRGGSCIPGLHKLFLTANGDFYPCERVNESSNATKIGTIDAGLDLSKIKELTNLESYTSSDCHNCWAYSFCEICLSGVENNESIDADLIKKRCITTRKNIEETFKDYCVLKELGYGFEKDIIRKNYNLEDIDNIKNIIDDKTIYSIDIPVLFIINTCENLQENNFIKELQNQFNNQKIKTFSLCNGYLTYKNDSKDIKCIWDNEMLSVESKIYNLNHILKSIENSIDTDLIIIEIPKGIGRLSNKINNGFGINLFIASEVTSPDCTIVNIPYEDYSKKDIVSLKSLLKNKYSIPSDYFNMLNKKICLDDSERLEKINYLTLDNEIVDNKIKSLNMINIYNLKHKNEIKNITLKIIEQLQSYTNKEPLEEK